MHIQADANSVKTQTRLCCASIHTKTLCVDGCIPYAVLVLVAEADFQILRVLLLDACFRLVVNLFILDYAHHPITDCLLLPEHLRSHCLRGNHGPYTLPRRGWDSFSITHPLRRNKARWVEGGGSTVPQACGRTAGCCEWHQTERSTACRGALGGIFPDACGALRPGHAN